MSDDVEQTQAAPEGTPDGAAEPGPDPRVAALEAELARAKDDHLRALAEVENTRRRGEKQTTDARAYAIDRFAGDLLPVADTLARAIAALTPEGRSALDAATRGLIEGVEMTERVLLDAFSRHGLKRIGARGDKFDPNLHQAVAQLPSADIPAGAVAEVMQPGYVLGERTVRAAIVAVSLGAAASAPATEAPPSASGSVDIKV